MPFLRRELQLLDRLRVVVALGGFALQALALAYRQRPRPRFAHGAGMRLSVGLNVLCSYHPSQQNTFTGRLSQEMFDNIFLEQSGWLGRAGHQSPEVSISVEEIRLGCSLLAQDHVGCLDMLVMLSR